MGVGRGAALAEAEADVDVEAEEDAEEEDEEKMPEEEEEPETVWGADPGLRGVHWPGPAGAAAVDIIAASATLCV